MTGTGQRAKACAADDLTDNEQRGDVDAHNDAVTTGLSQFHDGPHALDEWTTKSLTPNLELQQ